MGHWPGAERRSKARPEMRAARAMENCSVGEEDWSVREAALPRDTWIPWVKMPNR